MTAIIQPSIQSAIQPIAPQVVQQLDPLTVPLHGSRLIEASAGTGKTFTLAMLYVRLVLQHGGETAFNRPLVPPEILVVTFTNAATEELRDRIRRRLVEAAAVFRGQPPHDPSDQLLTELRNVMAGGDLAQCARRLDLAAEWMDEAAISTIHAWCYRMLREHAFDSANAFEQILVNDEADLLQQAAEDYWRTFILHLDAEALQLVLAQWSAPAALSKAVSALLPLVEYLPMADAPIISLRHYYQQLAAIKTTWHAQDYIAGLEQLFDEALKNNAFHKSKLNVINRGKVLNDLKLWIATPNQVSLHAFENESWKRMSALEIASIWKNPAQAPVDHPACQALAGLKDALAALPEQLTQALLAHATHWLKRRVEHEKHQQSLLTQTDLLIRLDAALQGAGGKRLAAVMRQQFPVALVDEFQDTDPIQYRIFDAIYQIRANSPLSGFFMIGDPKQAIYGFRGADIHTYLIARAATAGRHYTLPINYRSSTDLIAAVNGLFQHGEAQAKRGAFLFRTPDGAANPIPFYPVSARTQAEPTLMIDGHPCEPLHAWLIEPDTNGKLTKERYRQRTATAAARLIAQLLQLGQQGRARLPEWPDGSRPLQASDLAVLVANRGEADAIRAELQRLGVASVYLSERNNVFDTRTADDLVVILRAIASPFEDRLLRQALATALCGQALADLDRLNHDERYWEAQGERIRLLHDCWQRQGFLPMLYRLLDEFGMATRLLAQRDGERTMTDLLHLGELLQQASTELDGAAALVRYLEEAISASQTAVSAPPETDQLRLESDARLVRIVTIHKSKGLEYPLVFLPFAASCRRISDKDRPLKTHDDAHQLQVHLGGNPAIVQQADHERLGEDVRKLYVGLTRARYVNWLGLGVTEDFKRSAFGYLLGLPEEAALDTAMLAEQLRQLPKLVRLTAPECDPAPLTLTTAETLAPARSVTDWRPRAWWISSYSALIRETWRPVSAPETASDETVHEELSQPPESTAVPLDLPAMPVDPASLHAFPRGGRYGTFIHGVLEWAATQRAPYPLRSGFAAALTADHARRQMLTNRCTPRHLDDWIEPLDAWLTALLERTWSLTALAPPGGDAPTLRLADLDPSRYQVELEFWIEARQVKLATLDARLLAHTLNGRERPPLTGQQLNGMLKGFIDLVFEQQGRYYVLDWKSNWLGPDDRAYSAEAMQAAMCERRYDLQYVLYLLALHRQLKARLPDYDYDQHLGGAIYVFVRGAQADTHGLFMDRPPRALIDALDAQFAGA